MIRSDRVPRPRAGKAGRQLDLNIRAVAGKHYVPFIRKHLLAASEHFDSALVDVSLALVGDSRMSQLHQQFMNVTGPTDVLTFPLDFDDKGCATSGEIVICVSEAVRQARKRTSAVNRELLLYAIHGMLHLSGYDDLTESAFRQMHAMEDKILTQIGLGPVFGDLNSTDTSTKVKPRAKKERLGD